jgi:hypothetical protein
MQAPQACYPTPGGGGIVKNRRRLTTSDDNCGRGVRSGVCLPKQAVIESLVIRVPRVVLDPCDPRGG